MEALISQHKILEITKISTSQFKAFRRLGLIDGHVKKISIVKPDEKKTKANGRPCFRPSGFSYLYPRRVLKQITWIRMQQEQGKNLREIQNESIRIKIQQEAEKNHFARKYETCITLPTGADQEGLLSRKLMSRVLRELSEQIKNDHPEREVETLVFLVEPEEQGSGNHFEKRVRIKLDVETSQF